MSSYIFRITRNFVFNFTNFCIQNICSTKLLVFGSLFSTSLIFVFKTVAVTTPLVPCICFIPITTFFSNFCLSVLYWLTWIKLVASRILLSKLCWIFRFWQLHHLHLIFSSLQEQFSIYQHLSHLLLFFNNSNGHKMVISTVSLQKLMTVFDPYFQYKNALLSITSDRVS